MHCWNGTCLSKFYPPVAHKRYAPWESRFHHRPGNKRYASLDWHVPPLNFTLGCQRRCTHKACHARWTEYCGVKVTSSICYTVIPGMQEQHVSAGKTSKSPTAQSHQSHHHHTATAATTTTTTNDYHDDYSMTAPTTTVTTMTFDSRP